MDSMTIHRILPELEPSFNTLYYLVLGSKSERIGRIVMESIDPSIRRLARDNTCIETTKKIPFRDWLRHYDTRSQID